VKKPRGRQSARGREGQIQSRPGRARWRNVRRGRSTCVSLG